MRFLRLLPLLPFLLLAACKPAFDPATLQTSATEAALRFVIQHCPKRAEAELAVIAVGENMAKPLPAFVDRFRDITGLTFIDYARVVAGKTGDLQRRYDERTNKPVLELQISSLTEEKDGVQVAVAAWAWKEEAGRSRLELKATPGGGYEVRELEKIPIPKKDAPAK
jgi:hypothetical protein